MEKITAQTGPLAFIGGGAMTEAIIKGILGAGLADPGEIFVGEPSAARCEYLQKTYGIKASGDNKAAAMPPQATVLSIMGSVDLAKLHQVVPGHAVIRVMPNTPLAVGAGMTAIAPDSKVSSEMIDAAKTIFGSCGEVEVVAESAIEAITAVSGCGPGYVFMLIDALADAGVNAGLPRALAIKLAAQTFAGSGKMVLETALHPAQLRDQVTSPGGTTIAGIHALENRGVRAAMYDAVLAVLERSEKLKGK